MEVKNMSSVGQKFDLVKGLFAYLELSMSRQKYIWYIWLAFSKANSCKLLDIGIASLLFVDFA